ncbi:MAG: DsrE family protein [Thioploca sp.]|nr:DsrE family protein [Thioploca sp.]
MKKIFNCLLITLSLVITPLTALAAEELNDADALKDLKVGKVIWDIGTDNPAKLALYLKVIQKTHEGLVQQKVTPEMVFAFHGGAVKLITTDREPIPLEQHGTLDEIAKQIANLQKQSGVKMEVCGLATALFNVKNSSILPGIKPVGNTFISIIGYHAQGYVAIPVY